MVFLGRTRKIHFVGIGGIGMSGIAELLLNLGFEVSGSDLKPSDTTRNLERLGAVVYQGHDAANLKDVDVVVYSSAVNATNPEIVEATSRAVPVIPRTEMLAELMRLKFAVTVAGSHGKTSTTSIVGSVLARGGLDPTVVVGGKLKAIGTNALLGQGRYLVAEADESDGKFVQLPSSIAIITNIDLEHLDHYADLEAIKDAFVDYAARVPFYGSVIVCTDDENVRSIMPRIRRRKITYGLTEPADLMATITKRDERGCVFTVRNAGREIGEMRTVIPGDHYVLNTLAAIAVGLELDVPFDLVKAGVESFEGVGRRFEIKGEARGITVVDDYGHHPTEVAATIRAARRNFGKRLIVVFQPHRYTRTQALADRFAVAFEGTHTLYVTDIYAAGEPPIPDVTAEMLIEKIRGAGMADVRKAGSFEKLVEELVPDLEDGDMVLTLGAGDVYRFGELLLSALREGEK